MFVLALAVDIHVPTSQSLKAKRQVVRSVLQAAQRRFGVSVAEVGGQDTWQRAELGFAVVASSAGQAEAVIDEVRSEEHTSELQSLMRISDAVFCLQKKKHKTLEYGTR